MVALNMSSSRSGVDLQGDVVAVLGQDLLDPRQSQHLREPDLAAAAQL